MAKTKRMMETDDKGIQRQFFPQTHAGAVLGLKDFLEGDFFQADFDRVMALLEERSDKAFAEIDKKSEAMEKHADEKITEFDNKIAATNQTLATLEKEIYDTQQTFENMDVFNKQESSANVLDQVIGKDEVEVTLTLDFKNKVVGSDVENPNIAGGRQVNTILEPSGNWYELNQGMYNQIKTKDSNLFEYSSNEVGNLSQVLFEYNVFAYMKSYLGERFFADRGATTTTQQVSLICSVIETLSFNVYGSGRSASGNNLTVSAYENISKKYSLSSTNLTGDIRKISKEIPKANFNEFIAENGFVYIIAYADASDGTVASSVNIDYVNLEITLKLSANEHIKSMMAAYHRENEKYTFEKVGEV